MSENRKISFKRGLIDGIPIALGYLAVSFTFGIQAAKEGLSIFQSTLLSFTNLTSAGQFAGLSIIATGASYLEMAFTQLIINLRYCLMSCSLSQKLDNSPFYHRFIMSYGITDEIFGICSGRPKKLSPFYCYGAICVASPGWAMGTFLGALSGSILPDRILSALGVALYGMFIAIVIPPAKENKIIRGLVITSMIASFLFSILPVLKNISSGFTIIILTIIIAGIAAFLFPIDVDSDKKEVMREDA